MSTRGINQQAEWVLDLIHQVTVFLGSPTDKERLAGPCMLQVHP